MGPKKGGGKSFLKAARAAKADAGDAGNTQQSAAAAPEPAAPAPAAAPASQPAISSKAAAFLKQETVPAAAEISSSDNDGEAGVETRGQVLQRHKREQKALKDQIKRLGKKSKEDGAKLEAEMASRQAAELAALAGIKKKTAAEAVAVADSLYTVHLGEQQEGEQQSKKQSKGQKWRERRQREEAEREVRIQAEVAELGDTARVVEERELKAILRPLRLMIREIPPDGHCLYRSLEDQLQQLPAEVAPPPTAAAGDDGEELNFMLLRQKAAEYMRQHADEFKPFVLEEDATTSSGADDAFEEYCTELESTAAWGGHVELQALARALQSHIVVYCVGMPVLELGEEHKDSGRTLRLCYLRHAYGLGEHYESVVSGLMPVEDEERQAQEQEQWDGEEQRASARNAEAE